MKRKVSRLLLWVLGGLFSISSHASVVADVQDKTPECLKKVDWEKDAFRIANIPKEIHINATAFDALVACAYAPINFREGSVAGATVVLSDGIGFAPSIPDLKAKYPSLAKLIDEAGGAKDDEGTDGYSPSDGDDRSDEAGFRGSTSQSSSSADSISKYDLLIGNNSEQQPTAFYHARYFVGVALQKPVAKIVRGDVSYVRSPEYPGFCDSLKGNAERYEWCTGTRKPGSQSEQLRACKDQYCDERL
ncbi:MAG TPA: hypothetical protein VM621_13190 [Luteibacter sp.]|uniref:hypothetical protein n=1 Tax=Luteibacter sp. TaxID=1886636 RepID=UPI002B9B9514|nr:hypothetical protein [Luteibacter sp.]HVI55992.1 hypothetical protein [Luteibacter sp.]